MPPVSAQRRRTPKARQTRQRILDSAAKVLRERGYADTTLEAVAVLADLRAPSVYYYFKSRDEVISEVVRSGAREGIAELHEALEKLPAATEPLDKLSTLIEVHLREVTTRSDYASARIRNLTQLPITMREQHRQDDREFWSIWGGVLNEAVEASSVEDRDDAYAALLLHLGSMNWASEWWHPTQRPPLNTVIRTAQLMMMRGIAPGRKIRPVDSLEPLPEHSDATDATESKSTLTRARILRAAADVIATRQYASTRLTDIAEAAGLQYQTIYYYYDTKESLIAEVVRQGIVHTRERINQALAELAPESTGLAKLLIAVRVQLETVLRDCPFALVAIRNLVRLPKDLWSPLMAEQDRYEGIWRELIKEGVSDGSISQDLDPECVIMLLVGGLDMSSEWWDPQRMSLDELVPALQRFAERALRV